MGSLRGEVRIPGDKSISHRALILGALGEGVTTIDDFVSSADCLSTMACLRALGVHIDHHDGHVTVEGRGLRGFSEPTDVLNAGNSGTTVRMLSGVLSGQSFYSVITGDESLRRRPMARVAEPLRQMGATILGRGQNNLRLPLTILGGKLRATDHILKIASAQVKSALLLAGLYADGKTIIHEPAPSRDHTERMLRAMGAEVVTEGSITEMKGLQTLHPTHFDVPGDVSSAAFFLVGAAITPGSRLILQNVGINPTRTGILDVLRAMGAQIALENERLLGQEPVADLIVGASELRGTVIEGEIIPRLIDELPILAVAATQAQGETIVRDAGELRVKETDRLAAIVTELSRLGADIQATADGFIVHGPTPLRGAACSAYNDHRMAMAMTIAGLVASGETTIDNITCMDVSFPGFLEVLKRVTVS